MRVKSSINDIKIENLKKKSGASKKVYIAAVFFVVCALFVAAIGLAMIPDHECYDEHCFICHQVQELKQLSRLLGIGFAAFLKFFLAILLLFKGIMQPILLTAEKTAVSLKVRMNC